MIEKYEEFIKIAKELNHINIIPVLYGSLGLSIIINQDLNPEDIDILIPKRFLKQDWSAFKILIEKQGYKLIDLHEHEFQKNNIKIAFADEEDLLPYANIDYTKLEIVSNNCKYKKLKLEDFLKSYTSSLKDGYRQTKKNNKDKAKIKIIKENMR
jgi:hypothetical protein